MAGAARAASVTRIFFVPRDFREARNPFTSFPPDLARA
jgi:hypothetical protein